MNVEVGFDIDDSAKEENEDEDEEEWMIEMTGVREVGQSMELIDSVKKTIMWEENDAALLKQQIQCCIEKLMPRLRFESTYRERGERGFVDRVEGDCNTRVLQVLHVTKTDV